MTMNSEEGTALLRKLGLLEVAIDFATESGAFAQAFELSKAGAKQKLPEVGAGLRGRGMQELWCAHAGTEVCVRVYVHACLRRCVCQCVRMCMCGGVYLRGASALARQGPQRCLPSARAH